MINYLEGLLVAKQPPKLIIAIGGIGYEVHVPLSILWDLPAIGHPVKIFSQFIVREDAHTLYGFKTPSDKELFNQLLKVNGIGPKVALAILSGLSVQECYRAVLAKDLNAFTAIPGIGKKTAERLLMELQDKMGALEVTEGAAPMTLSLAHREAMEALLSLGYTSKEAQKAIGAVKEAGDSTEVLIKRALQGLVVG